MAPADYTVARIDDLEGSYNGLVKKARAIGGVPGEPYTPPAYTELGAIDPLVKRPGT